LRYLIRSFKYQPTTLVEDDDVHSHEQFEEVAEEK
jgi:hypothetical protein